MKLEQLNEEMLQPISNEEMCSIQGGGNGATISTSLTCIYSTGSCGCTDAGDVD